MSALVTENAPDFTANAVMGDNSFRKFKLSSLKGRYVVLKASGGNIGTMRYRPGEAESFLSQYGHLGYWKKERVGDTLYYFLGNPWDVLWP